jgi:apolipoprotein N-acyltransferase
MGSPLARPILLALLAGLLYTVSLPNFDLGFLAWVALVPLHCAIAGATRRRAFWIGWLAGTASFVGSMFWVITAMHLYGKVPLPISVALMLLLSAYLGLYVAIYALAYQYLSQSTPSPLPSLSSGGRGRMSAALGAPFLWVTLEWVRTYLFSGLPWSLLGYSQYTWLPVIQIADITAVYGVSFIVVLVNVAIAETVKWFLRYGLPPPLIPFPIGGRGNPKGDVSFPLPVSAAALVVLAMTLLYGHMRLASLAGDGDVDAATRRTIRVGVVQANIDQAVKWDEAYRRATHDSYARLTATAAVNSDLVVWPEAATPYLFEREPEFRAEVAAVVKTAGVSLLFGSPALGFNPDRRPYLMNTAYLLATDGRILGRYDKRHLVPFGEYIPLHDSALFFLDKLVEGIGDFKAGKEATVLSLPAIPASPLIDTQPLTPNTRPLTPLTQPPTPNPRFGVVICYEVIFPNEVREFAAKGADFMVTITNDAWFGRSSAPYQHFGMVVLRAVENRLSFARAANTGISGFVDPTGRILEATPIFSQAAISGKIPVGRIPTFYSEHGDVFAYACVIIAAALLVGARLRGARDKRTAAD